MSIESYESRLRGLPVDEARLLSHESMARHTTFRIGGPADLFLSVATEQEAAAACALAQEECVPITVIGNEMCIRDSHCAGNRRAGADLL